MIIIGAQFAQDRQQECGHVGRRDGQLACGLDAAHVAENHQRQRGPFPHGQPTRRDAARHCLRRCARGVRSWCRLMMSCWVDPSAWLL
jgi:hypothetical protein